MKKLIFHSRVMMGGFPLIIPNDPIMQMKIAEKVSANIREKSF
jgi:hypothetical protein